MVSIDAFQGETPEGFHIPSVKTRSSSDESPLPYLSTYPVRLNESAQSLIDGVEAFSAMCSAVESAKSSVCITVSYLQVDSMELPGNRGHLFDVLWAAAKRGVHVRCIIWSEPILGTYANVFNDRPERLKALAEKYGRSEPIKGSFTLRWDRFPPANIKAAICGPIHCHHQKSWLIDGVLVFVGGMNIGNGYFTYPGHEVVANPISFKTVGERDVHDIYLKLTGAGIVKDVYANFTERWNNASSVASKSRNNRQAYFSVPDGLGLDDYLEPLSLIPSTSSSGVRLRSQSSKSNASNDSNGTIPIQLTRTMPVYPAYSLKQEVHMKEEVSILGQYLVAIAHAKTYIYIENQSCQNLEILAALSAAVARDVYVTLIVPHKVQSWSVLDKPMHEHLTKMSKTNLFTFACLAINNLPGKPSKYFHPHIHAKLMIIDDEWLTVGSCNIAERSLKSDTELNASVWDKPLASSTFRRLISEHTSEMVLSSEPITLLKKLKELADTNKRKYSTNTPITGHVVSLDVPSYGKMNLQLSFIYWYISVLLGILHYFPSFPHIHFKPIMQFAHIVTFVTIAIILVYSISNSL